jgi:hypothetical protein
LIRLAEAADIDHEGVSALDGEFSHEVAELPGVVVIKVWQAKLSLLVDDAGEIVVGGGCHG